MELEIKHLATYLPYGLKFKDNEGGIFEIDGLFIDLAIHLKETNRIDYFHKYPAIKPILFPLSWLTKEQLIPIGLIIRDIEKHKATWKDNVFAVEDARAWIRGGMRPVLSLPQASSILEYLFSIKADVFGLIEQDLAIAVTEEFNPYK